MKLLKVMVLLLVAGPTPVVAVPVSYVFTGTFGTAEQGCWMRAGPDVCGTPLFGYFTIDDEPVFTDDSGARYFGAGGPYGMYLSVGGQSGWNSMVGLELFHENPRSIFSSDDLVLFHTGTAITSGGGGDPEATLTFGSWWLSRDVFDGPARFEPMPDPSRFNVCALAIEGCYITVGQSWVNPRTIFDWTFFRSPVVIPMPVPEPGTLILLGVGLLMLAQAMRPSPAARTLSTD